MKTKKPSLNSLHQTWQTGNPGTGQFTHTFDAARSCFFLNLSQLTKVILKNIWGFPWTPETWRHRAPIPTWLQPGGGEGPVALGKKAQLRAALLGKWHACRCVLSSVMTRGILLLQVTPAPTAPSLTPSHACIALRLITRLMDQHGQSPGNQGPTAGGGALCGFSLCK